MVSSAVCFVLLLNFPNHVSFHVTPMIVHHCQQNRGEDRRQEDQVQHHTQHEYQPGQQESNAE